MPNNVFKHSFYNLLQKAFRSWKIKERHGEDEDADDDLGINNQDTAPRRRNKNSARNQALNDFFRFFAEDGITLLPKINKQALFGTKLEIKTGAVPRIL